MFFLHIVQGMSLCKFCVNFYNAEVQKKERSIQILVLMQRQVTDWVGMSLTVCWEIIK